MRQMRENHNAVVEDEGRQETPLRMGAVGLLKIRRTWIRPRSCLEGKAASKGIDTGITQELAGHRIEIISSYEGLRAFSIKR